MYLSQFTKSYMRHTGDSHLTGGEDGSQSSTHDSGVWREGVNTWNSNCETGCSDRYRYRTDLGTELREQGAGVTSRGPWLTGVSCSSTCSVQTQVQITLYEEKARLKWNRFTNTYESPWHMVSLIVARNSWHLSWTLKDKSNFTMKRRVF